MANITVTRNSSHDTSTSITTRLYYRLKNGNKYYDLKNLFKPYTLTINPTPSDATVTLTAPNATQVGNSITVHGKNTVTYTVSKTNYLTQTGTILVDQDMEQDIILVSRYATFTINPDPSDATVTLTATGYTQTGNSITVEKGTSVNWTVDAGEDYNSQSGTQVVNEDIIKNIKLAPNAINYIFRNLDNGNTLAAPTGALEDADDILDISSYQFEYAFYNQANIIGTAEFNNLTTIDTKGSFRMFSNCTGLTSASFPSLTTINGTEGCYEMFSECNGLTTVSFPSLTTINGTNSCYGMFSKCNGLTTVSFPKLMTVNNDYSCEDMFSNCKGLTSASFPSLTTINSYGCEYMFSNCTKLTSVSLPSLATINGLFGCGYMFNGCTGLTSISFPSLTTIGNGGCYYMLTRCTDIEHVYFPALTTSSFGSYTNQFQNMLNNTGNTKTHTIHFPSNLQSKISTLNGYPTFGGTSGYVTLSFDLPATS